MPGWPENEAGDVTVLDAGTRELVVAHASELLFDAANGMLQAGVRRLALVAKEDPKAPIGYLGCREILSARMKRMHDEGVREAGWWKGWKRKAKVG